jgi:hypothetical protein
MAAGLGASGENNSMLGATPSAIFLFEQRKSLAGETIGGVSEASWRSL